MTRKVKLEVNNHDDCTLFLEKEFNLRDEIDEIAIPSSKQYAQRDENGRLSSKSLNEYDVLLHFLFKIVKGKERVFESLSILVHKRVDVYLTLSDS